MTNKVKSLVEFYGFDPTIILDAAQKVRTQLNVNHIVEKIEIVVNNWSTKSVWEERIKDIVSEQEKYLQEKEETLC